MSYKGPWRNRLRNLYIQYCYLDELAILDPKLKRGLESGLEIVFDDEWIYRLANHKQRTSRQVVHRYPLWWNMQEHKMVEKGDVRHRKNGQRELMMIIPQKPEAKQ